MATPIPTTLSKPAQRALAAAGYTTLEELTGAGVQHLSSLHGVGPTTIHQLRAALADAGLSFPDGQ